MEYEISQENGFKLVEIKSDKILIKNTQDALDLMADFSYQDINKIILNEKNFTSDFFDLKTKLAGDILQKFTNYKMQLVIIGDFSKYSSKSLQDFIYESNKHGQINFVQHNSSDVSKSSEE